MKVPLEKIYEHLDFASDRLSTQIRTLALGDLALVWLFLSGNKDAPVLKLGGSNEPLLVVASLCVITLLIDAIQYWAYYFSSNSVRRKAEDAGKKEAEYDEANPIRRVQMVSFWLKQITALLATLWLLALIFVSLAR